MKTKNLLAAILFIAFGLLRPNTAVACHSVALDNFSISIDSPANPGMIVVNGSSHSSTNGCTDKYYMVVQIQIGICPFPSWSSPILMPSPSVTAWSQLVFTGATKPVQTIPYPQITYNMSNLCPGKKYRIRVGEYVYSQAGGSNPIVWVPQTGGAGGMEFNVLGTPTPLVLNLTTSKDSIDCGEEITLHANLSPLPPCYPSFPYNLNANYTWNQNLPGGSITSHVVNPDTSTWYKVEYTNCALDTVTDSVFVYVRPADTTHYVTKCPRDHTPLIPTMGPSTIMQYNPQTFSNLMRYPVKDFDTIKSPIMVSGLNVAALSNASDIMVCFTILHPRASDVEIRLYGPGGILYDVSIGNGGTGANYNNACFKKQGFPTLQIINNVPNAPYGGTYVPQGGGVAFAPFHGQDPNGLWELVVYDKSTGIEGSIESWSITINDETVVPNPYFSWDNHNFLVDPNSFSTNTFATTSQEYVLTSSAGPGGCAFRDSFIVTVLPSNSFANTMVGICPGATAQLNAYNSLTCNWAVISGPALNSNAICNPSTTPPSIADTAYYYEITMDDGQCVTVDTVTVVVGGVPNAQAFGPANTCIGSSAQLVASGGASYQWLAPYAAWIPGDKDIANPVAYIPAPPGPPAPATPGPHVFSVQITDTIGCTDTAYVTLNLVDAPAFTATPDKSTICVGETVQFSITQGNPNNFLWDGPNLNSTSIANPTASPTTTSTYTIKSFEGACSFTNTIVITVNTPVGITATSEEICLGKSGTLTTNANGPVWEPNIGLSPNNLVQNPTVTGTNTMLYTVRGKDANGCDAETTAKLTVNAVPTVNAGPDISLCHPYLSTELKGIRNPSTASFTWTSNNPGNVSYALPAGPDTLRPFVSFFSPIETEFILTANNGKCESKDTMTVYFSNKPREVIPTVSNAPCFGGKGTATIDVVPSGSYTYEWSHDPTITGNGPMLSAGLYFVKVSDGDCSITEPIVIKQAREMEIHFSTVPEWCKQNNGIATVDSVSHGKAPFTYTWENSSGASLNNVWAGEYTVTVISADGCEQTGSVDIGGMGDGVIAGFEPSAIEGYPPLTIDFLNTSLNAISYEWDFSNGEKSNLENPSMVFTEPGKTYRVRLKASGTHCYDTASFLITVGHILDYEIPNVFTPNGDGRNELFTINGIGMETFNGTIYSRWGRKVYEWDNPLKGWDGSGAEDGVYFYVINFTPYSPKKPVKLSGHVTLIR